MPTRRLSSSTTGMARKSYRASSWGGRSRRQPAEQGDAVVVRHLLDQPGHVRPAGAFGELDLHVDREVLEDGRLVADGRVLEDAPDLLDGKVAGERLGDGGGVQRRAER